MCRTCIREVLAKGGNTSNLMAQLREHHPDLYAEAMALQDQQRANENCSRRGNAKRNSTIGGISDNSMYFNVIQLQYENVLFVQLEF